MWFIETCKNNVIEASMSLVFSSRLTRAFMTRAQRKGKHMRHPLFKARLFLLLITLTACGGGGASVSNGVKQATPSLQVSRPALGSDARLASVNSSRSTYPQASAGVAIDAGSPAAVGNWIPDRYYNGGQIAAVRYPINTSHVSNPAPQILYQTQRWSRNLTYTIPGLSANAAYSVRLHFVESFWNAPGQRVFDVKINGTQVLTNFDIFQAAGGGNIAVAEQFGASADTQGKIIIELVATVDNASVAGIAISSGTATPTPPSPLGADALPWMYSPLWSRSSPFKTTVTEHMSQGATVIPHIYMDSLWNEGIAGNGTASGIPIYVAKSSDPLSSTVCTLYGGNCNANNVQIHIPSYATAQRSSDDHIVIVDQHAPVGPIELDCWQATTSRSQLRCSWAGVYNLGSAGTAENGSEGTHGGMAVTAVVAAGQEFLNGQIDHALGMNTRCLNDPTLYPADTTTNTDTSCDGSRNPPHYGNLMHLLWSPYQISTSDYSTSCKAVLTALVRYGAYLNDTGNNGLQIETQNELSYTEDPAMRSRDPWPGVQSKLNSAGDGIANSWYSCLTRLRSSDFELIQIAHP